MCFSPRACGCERSCNTIIAVTIREKSDCVRKQIPTAPKAVIPSFDSPNICWFLSSIEFDSMSLVFRANQGLHHLWIHFNRIECLWNVGDRSGREPHQEFYSSGPSIWCRCTDRLALQFGLVIGGQYLVWCTCTYTENSRSEVELTSLFAKEHHLPQRPGRPLPC